MDQSSLLRIGTSLLGLGVRVDDEVKGERGMNERNLSNDHDQIGIHMTPFRRCLLFRSAKTENSATKS